MDISIKLTECFWQRLVANQGFSLTEFQEVESEALLAFLQSMGLTFRVKENWCSWVVPLELWDSARLSKVFSKLSPTPEILIKRVTASTNLDLMDAVSYYPQQHFLCLTEYQTKGKGTRERRWVSAPFTKGLYLSFNWQVNDLHSAVRAGLWVAIAIFHTLKARGIKDLAVRWPNDLVWHGKKLAGILVESSSSRQHQLLIGIGINLDLPLAWGKNIEQPFTSLADIWPGKLDRHELIIELVIRLWYQLQKQEDLRRAWQEVDFYYQRKLTVKLGDKIYQGLGCGIDEEGYLLLKTSEKILKCQGAQVELWTG